MKSEVKLSLIVARDRNGIIGHDGKLPWRLADDLAFFKSATLGHPVIMGRKTWESLPKKPLPGRDNIVLSRDWMFRASGARVFTLVEAAIAAGKALALASGKREVFIIGGAAIYAATIDRADRLYITEVDADVDGDVSFPAFDMSGYSAVTAQTVARDDRNEHAFEVRILTRCAR